MKDFTTHKGHLFIEADNLLDAWEKVNEYLAVNEKNVFKRGGGVYGSELISHDNHISIKNCVLDPEFDFGETLGYSKQKWTTLVNNYIDKVYLDLLRSEINYRDNRNSKSYNYSFHFSNKAGNGKDCLISMIFHKRATNQKPIVYFKLRTSEVTKRLLFDFLLVQRVVEYIYGNNDVEVQCVFPSMYITAESFCLYHLHKDITKIFDPNTIKEMPYQQKILIQFRFLMETPLSQISYKVHKRVGEMLQIHKGLVNTVKKPMVASSLTL